MPFLDLDGVRLHVDDTGAGPPVLLIAGTGARGRTWHLHQVPALVAAGYRVVTYDNRGIPPSTVTPAMTIDDLVRDAAGVIESLGLGPCRVAGHSMGAQIAQELCLARPDLVGRVALLGARGRDDAFCTALLHADRELFDRGTMLPPGYAAVVRASQNLSPHTLADDRAVRDWLDIFQLPGPPDDGKGTRAQLDVDLMGDRLEAYRGIRTPALVLSFTDDIVAPPARGREIAGVIPGARYAEIPRAGHYGYFEQPEAVNAALLEFFGA
ncbi:alpha/beta fold hydrolase [Catenuloplanes japonicus]|uniref:alpha/beta fold hydrolase n=1 Tax=Catenuloplanes japonicus TaxID=33876 RepID=UPI000524CFDD|nr:alpha/beta hydrolase [Catenuloplanes japonicus]